MDPGVASADESAMPDAVQAIIGDRRHTLVWRNEVGGRTYRIDECAEYVKWSPARSGIDLAREADRLRWAIRWTVVPRVLTHGGDEHGSWLVTAALPGQNAINTRWRRDPAVAVSALGRSLRDLHDALPVASCPFSWSVPDRLVGAREVADPRRWHVDHAGLTVDDAFALLAEPPPIDRSVVCHGDACAPNTLLDADGHVTGHVDLGELGVADRWADLAVATWSATWNYGPGWEDTLLDAYGVQPDPVRTAYYRLLWDVSPV